MYTIALILAAVGGINWGLIGLFDLNVVSLLFGIDTVLTNIIYVLVGAAALYLLVAYATRTSVHGQQRTRVTRDDRERYNRPATAHR